MADIDPESTDFQIALAMTALAHAFARTLEEIAPRHEALDTLQGKTSFALRQLRRSPQAQRATAIFQYVHDALRDPDIIRQPGR